MNLDQLEGKWEQLKGDAKTRWGKLTDDDLKSASGNKDQLVGRIQEKYGIAKEDAERQVKQWLQSKQDDWKSHLDRKAG